MRFWDGSEEGASKTFRPNWLRRLSTGHVPTPHRAAANLLSPCRQRFQARPPVFLQAAQYIDMGFPNENVSSGRVAPDSAPGKWSAPNPPQAAPKQAKECRRRGNAPRPCAPAKRNSGPYSTSVKAHENRVNSTEGLPRKNMWKNREKRRICADFVGAEIPTALNVGVVIPQNGNAILDFFRKHAIVLRSG